MQLRFASFAVANLREDFHLQDRTHAGRTTKTAPRLEGRMDTGGESVIRTRDLRIMIPSL